MRPVGQSFSVYLHALTEFLPWFFALDHTNYAYWIPVHLRDMTDIQDTQILPENVMLAILPFTTIYQLSIVKAHEQNNGCIKSDGVGLTDNPSALWQWIVAGPEAAVLIEDFETRKCVQKASRKDVCSLVNVMEQNLATHSKRAKACFSLTTKRLRIL